MLFHQPNISFSQGSIPQISLNPNITYQTMTGWQAVSQSGAIDETNGGLNPAFPRYKDELFNRAVNELGLNTIMIGIPRGIENPVDYHTKMMNGQITYDEYKTHRYETINDNNNPTSINLSGFQFSGLDFIIENIVKPLQSRLQARGEKLYINLKYIGSTDATTFNHSDYPEEYAEIIQVAFEHLNTKYGFVPDSLELVNEPNLGNKGWDAIKLTNALIAAAKRLHGIGFNPEIIAPSNSSGTASLTWFDQMIQNPEVRQYLDTFSYHCYGGCDVATLQAIGDRGRQYNKKTAMLELIGRNYQGLHEDLKLANVSSWEQFTLAYYLLTDNGGKYYLIDQSIPTNPVVIIGHRSKFLSQYFKYIRKDAIRIDAATTDINFDPVAFINKDGKYVVVVNAAVGGNFTIRGLPSGTYGITYTTNGHFNDYNQNILISANQQLSTSIPDTGAITIYAISPNTTVSPPTLTPVPTATPIQTTCLRKSLGDASCDNLIDGVDYSIWLNSQCHPQGNQQCVNTSADYSFDGNIDDIDYNIWFNNRGR